jgi:acetyl/propionyl-CoA carboxylase alpha subunit
MTKAGVPCIPGYHGANQDPDYLKSEAANIGYPVLLKAVKGGGGKGMRIVNTEHEFFDQLESAKSEARNSFGDDVMLVEKYITTPRHIEVQVFADKHGNCVALGERDCSIQRRHQKILEESPAPHLKEEIRQDIWEKARQAALAVGYEGAGTVEFIFDNDSGEFFFMEMNTRLQVEHPVTEMVTGTDLVRWQLIVAEGGRLPLTQQEIEQRIKERGHAIEARIYAENPDMNFIPDSGLLLHLRTPTPSPTVRIDSGFIAGDEVSSHYDPMISKLIVQGPTREAAIQKLRAALEEYEVAGPITNIEFIKRMCVSPDFVAGDVETGYIQKHHAELFTPSPPPPEIFAQAALGLALQQPAARRGPLCAGAARRSSRLRRRLHPARLHPRLDARRRQNSPDINPRHAPPNRPRPIHRLLRHTHVPQRNKLLLRVHKHTNHLLPAHAPQHDLHPRRRGPDAVHARRAAPAVARGAGLDGQGAGRQRRDEQRARAHAVQGAARRGRGWAGGEEGSAACGYREYEDGDGDKESG